MHDRDDRYVFLVLSVMGCWQMERFVFTCLFLSTICFICFTRLIVCAWSLSFDCLIFCFCSLNSRTKLPPFIFLWSLDCVKWGIAGQSSAAHISLFYASVVLWFFYLVLWNGLIVGKDRGETRRTHKAHPKTPTFVSLDKDWDFLYLFVGCCCLPHFMMYLFSGTFSGLPFLHLWRLKWLLCLPIRALVLPSQLLYSDTTKIRES